MLVSISDYARYKNVSKMAVSKAIQAGRISVEAREGNKIMLDPIKADKEWVMNTNISKSRTNNSFNSPYLFDEFTEQDVAKSLNSEKPQKITTFRENITKTANEEQALEAKLEREIIRTRKERIELEEMESKLVSKEECGIAMAQTWNDHFNNLKLLPNLLARDLTTIDKEQLKESFDKNILQLMDALKNELIKKKLFHTDK